METPPPSLGVGLVYKWPSLSLARLYRFPQAGGSAGWQAALYFISRVVKSVAFSYCTANASIHQHGRLDFCFE